jgi:hypothetical protein
MGATFGMFVGHALRLSQTNAGGFVAVCECGWGGNVHQPPIWKPAPMLEPRAQTGKAISAALHEHSDHVRLERRRTALALDPKVVSIVRQTGRFSHH